MRLIVTYYILLCLTGQEGLGARILGLFPAPIKSHLSVTSPLMHALAKKGHDVTMFVPFHTGFNASNYREITYEHTPISSGMDIIKYAKTSLLLNMFGFYYLGTMTTEEALNTPEAKALMRSEEKYDIIVMEQFLNEAFFAYVHKFNCPVILISTFGTTTTINRIFGNSAPYSYVPSEFVAFSDRITFLERLQNTLIILYADFTRKYYYMPRQQALADKYLSGLGHVIPSIEEIERKADFVLINSHPVFSTPRPYMTNMKDVAGMHLKLPKPLPLDLQKYLDSSKNGVILFSFGSAVHSIMMPDSVIRVLKGAFERLPYDVLWKWENDTMASKPKNGRDKGGVGVAYVVQGNIVTNNDIDSFIKYIWDSEGKEGLGTQILAHPNLKLFVTHGGISSLMETVYHAVPIVGIPVLGDQKRNILYAKAKGYAEILNFEDMTEDEIYNAIMKVANDPKYRENIKKVSGYWRDEMNHPLDTAVHWVEYVLKHEGAGYLKATVTELNFIQYFLLDVGFTILLILILVCFVSYKILMLLCKKSSYKIHSKKTN